MKRIYIASVLIFIFLFNIASANTTIAFVDMEKILKTTNVGASVIKQLTDLNDKNLEFFKSNEKILKGKETKLIAQRNILAENEFQIKVDELKIEIKDYNKNRNEQIKNFQNIQIENRKILLKLINPFLAIYSEQNSISVILQKKNILIGKTELDITEKIIKIINSEVKEYKIKW